MLHLSDCANLLLACILGYRSCILMSQCLFLCSVSTSVIKELEFTAYN